MDNIIDDILYNRNQAGLVALSHLNLPLTTEKIHPEIAYFNTFMFTNSAKDSVEMNKFLEILPNFAYTFKNGTQEFLNGPLLSDIKVRSFDFLVELFIQLSFAYNEINDGMYSGLGHLDSIKILVRDRDMSYRYMKYKVTPSFLAIIPNLNLGDLGTILPNIGYVNTRRPLDDMLELVSKNSAVKAVFDKIVTVTTEYIPVFQSPKYILSQLLLENPTRVLDEIADCISSIEVGDYASRLYYIKTLSLFPKNDKVDNLIQALSTTQPQPTTELINIIREPIVAGVRLETLTEKYIDALLPISTNVETMKNVGNGEIWNRAKLVEKVSSGIQDLGTHVKNRTYYHWVILNNDIVVGYAGLHPMVGQTRLLQLRIFVGTQYRGANIGTLATKKILEMQNTTIPFRILGVVEKNNTASIKMLKKAGMVLSRPVKIRGKEYDVFLYGGDGYHNTFIISANEYGFQYDPLKVVLSQNGLKQASNFCSNPKFNWGSQIYCQMNNCLNGNEFVTNPVRLVDAVRKYFPDTPVSPTNSSKTMRVYILTSMIYNKFAVYVWNKSEFFSEDGKCYSIGNTNVFADSVLSKQLNNILTTVSNLLYKSVRISKKSIDGFQIYSVDMLIFPEENIHNVESSLVLKNVSEYNDYQYGTGCIKFSNVFFNWVTDCAIIPFFDNKESTMIPLYKNVVKKFGYYGRDYETAKRELPDLIDYPYLNLYTRDQEIIKHFNTLRDYKYIVDNSPYNLHNVRLQDRQMTFNNRYVRIISTKSEVSTIGSISDYFVEDIRVGCKFLNNLPIYVYYNQNVDKLIDTLKTEGLPANVDELRELLWRSKNKQCTTFKPKIIKYIIDMFKSKRVLDISSGWGDRLVGAMASDIELYHGFDPNVKLQSRYIEMFNFFRPYATNPNIICTVEPIPFENAELQPNFYDLVMSSPPYFTMEIYDENSQGQSTATVKDEKQWYTNFLAVWVDKCVHALKTGGIIALNINQERGKNYVNWLIGSLSSKITYLGMIGYSNEDGKNPQPIFIWRK